MTLPASGTIAIADLETEFGGSNPASLSQYYRGGSLVPNTPSNSGVPTSGTIALNNFYNASKQRGYLNLIASNSNLDGVTAPAIDSSNNAYIMVGQGTARINQNKFSSTGSTQINNSVTPTNAIYVNSSCVGPSGNVYVCGYTYYFNASYYAYRTAPWIAKYNSSGVFQWSQYLNFDSNGYPIDYGSWNDITVDASENLYVCGNFYVTTYSSTAYNPGFAKYDSNGNLSWATASYPIYGSGNGGGAALGISLDSSGNIYATAISSQYGVSVSYASLVKLNNSGSIQWYTNFYESSSNSGRPSPGCVVDSSGNIYLTYDGYSGNCYVIKFNSSGSIVWQKYFTNTGGQTYSTSGGNAIKTLAIDNTNGYVYINAQSNYSYGITIKLDLNGNIIWSKQLAASPTSIEIGGVSLSNNKTQYFSSYWTYISGTSTIIILENTVDGTPFSVTLDGVTFNYTTLSLGTANGGLTNFTSSYSQSGRSISQGNDSLSTSGSSATIYSQII